MTLLKAFAINKEIVSCVPDTYCSLFYCSPSVLARGGYPPRPERWIPLAGPDYAPSFEEPPDTTIELGVPLVKLEPDVEQEGLYLAKYNGFVEEGEYRVVVYAADEAGNQALPKMAQTWEYGIYLPLVRKNSRTGDWE